MCLGARLIDKNLLINIKITTITQRDKGTRKRIASGRWEFNSLLRQNLVVKTGGATPMSSARQQVRVSRILRD